MKTGRVEKYWRGASFWRPAAPGAGGVFWPDFIDRGLVPDLAAHTNDEIDFDSASRQIHRHTRRRRLRMGQCSNRA